MWSFIFFLGLAVSFACSAVLGWLALHHLRKRRDAEAALRALAVAIHPLLPLTDAAQHEHAIALGQALGHAYYVLGEIYPVAPAVQLW